MKILIIDKHILFRDGLASMLSGQQPDFSIVGGADPVKYTKLTQVMSEGRSADLT